MNNQNDITTSLLLRLFIPFGLGYAVSYLFRSINAVIAPNLILELNLSPSDLGLLTSAYFLCFAAFQLPLGMLLDRFGPRRVESALLLFAAGGALIFSLASSISGLLIGRALIGLGVSACLMAAFKSFSSWLPSERLPFAHGIQMVSGGVGALLATTPVEASLTLTDWRGVFQILAAATVIIALVIFYLVPERQNNQQVESFSEQLHGLRSVVTTRSFWYITPWAVASQATYLAVQSLWSGPWLRDVAGYSRPEVALVLWWIAIAMIIGYFSAGWLAQRLSRYGVEVAQVAATGMGLFLLSQVLLIVAVGNPTLLWIGFGLFGTSGILAYAILAQHFPQHIIGRCNSVLNLLVFAGAFATQWLVGIIIGFFPPGAEGGYSPQGYRAAFLTLIALQLAGAVWFEFCRRRHIKGRIKT